jgi:hypothetical protein
MHRLHKSKILQCINTPRTCNPTKQDNDKATQDETRQGNTEQDEKMRQVIETKTKTKTETKAKPILCSSFAPFLKTVFETHWHFGPLLGQLAASRKQILEKEHKAQLSCLLVLLPPPRSPRPDQQPAKRDKREEKTGQGTTRHNTVRHLRHLRHVKTKTKPNTCAAQTVARQRQR